MRKGEEERSPNISFKGTIPVASVPSTRLYLSKVLLSLQAADQALHTLLWRAFKIQTVIDSVVTSPVRLSYQGNGVFLFFSRVPRASLF